MTETQSRAAMAFYLNHGWSTQGLQQPLFEAFASDFRREPELALRFLSEAADLQSGDDLESMLAICGHFGALTSNAVPLLCRLLLAGFHTRHEDVARYLQDLRDIRSIQSLYDACFLNLPYFYDDGDALARKCTWALHDIGTPDAFVALRKLTRHPRPSVVAFALKRLPKDSPFG
jgi:hypothetical protein